MNLARYSIKALLGMATRAEIDAHKTYRNWPSGLETPCSKKNSICWLMKRRARKVLEKLFLSCTRETAWSFPGLLIRRFFLRW